MKGFTFNDLCAMLESDSSEKNSSLSENAEAIKTLIGSAAVLLGDTATGNVAGFIRAVSEKEKLIDEPDYDLYIRALSSTLFISVVPFFILFFCKQ